MINKRKKLNLRLYGTWTVSTWSSYASVHTWIYRLRIEFIPLSSRCHLVLRNITPSTSWKTKGIFWLVQSTMWTQCRKFDNELTRHDSSANDQHRKNTPLIEIDIQAYLALIDVIIGIFSKSRKINRISNKMNQFLNM